MTKNRICEMDKNLLVKLYAEKPASDIAKEHNLKPFQIQELLRLYDIPKPYRNKDGKALDINHIQDLYHKQSMSIKDICLMLNASTDMITNLLYTQQEKTKPTLEQLKNCLNLSKRQLAIKFGLKEYDIHRLLLEYNLISNPYNVSKEQASKEYETLSVDQIARKHHIEPINVSVKLKEYGLIKDVNIEQLRTLYCDERKTIKEILSILETSETTLWRLIKKHKLQRPFNPDRKEFFKLWNNNTKTVGENIKLMADYYKVSVNAIRLTAKKLNISKKTTPIKIKYTSDDLQKLLNKHGLFGLSVILQMTVPNVKRALRRYDIMIKKTPVKEPDIEAITHLYQTKHLHLKKQYSILEIAKELNMKPTPLQKLIKKYKILRPSLQ